MLDQLVLAPDIVELHLGKRTAQLDAQILGHAQEIILGARGLADLLGELSLVMRDASICGLGQAAPNPVDSVLRFFPHEVSA